MATLSSALSIALVALLSAHSVSAQGTSDVTCMSSFDWASNSKGQNPCLVAAWLQTQCNSGAFSVNSIAEGYHYIGPTTDATTQNICICSTPVYNLVSSCGACQNRTWISWSNWKYYCPQAMVSPQGQFPASIPSDTSVPHWAYLKPSDTNDFFNVTVARLATGPESTQVQSSVSTSSTSTSISSRSGSTTPYASGQTTSTGGGGYSTVTITTSSTAPPTTTPSDGGGGGSSTNVGAIAGGVVGGVLGIAIVAILGFFLLRKKPANNGASGPGGAGDTRAIATGGAGPAPEMGYNNTGSGSMPPMSPVSGTQPYVQSHMSGQTPYPSTIASGGYYPSDPSQMMTPPPQGYPQPHHPAPYEQPRTGYSGVPEV